MAAFIDYRTWSECAFNIHLIHKLKCMNILLVTFPVPIATVIYTRVITVHLCGFHVLQDRFGEIVGSVIAPHIWCPNFPEAKRQRNTLHTNN